MSTRRSGGAQLELRKPPLRDQVREPNLRLAKKLAGRHAIAGCRSYQRPIQRLSVLLVPASTCAKLFPTFVVDQPGTTAAGRQAEIRVVDAKQKPVLGPGREHPVRLETALRDQVVDQNADVRLVTAQLEALARRGQVRGIHAGNKSLRRRFFITGCSVDLAGQKQPRHAAWSRGAASAPSAG